MAELRLSRAAQTDFDEIIDYLMEVAGGIIAADYGERLRAAINRVAQSPGIGAPRQRLGPETRMTIVGRYLIFYDGGPGSDAVHVLRILHGSRNITPEIIARGRVP
jgi:plasmid stabilization system protein ParE